MFAPSITYLATLMDLEQDGSNENCSILMNMVFRLASGLKILFKMFITHVGAEFVWQSGTINSF